MRGKQASRRKIKPDYRFQDMRVTKFINHVMESGKKNKASKIVYSAIESAAENLKVEPMEAFNKALETVRPEMEVRPRRVGGATYQIPLPVPKMRGEFLAMRWIIEAARSRKGRPMAEKLTEELVNAFNAEGDAVKKKENTHKMAEANRAFSHFRW